MRNKRGERDLDKAKDVVVDEVTIRLEVDEYGWSSVFAIKKDKKLKSLPAKYKKNAEVEKLKDFNKILRDQYRRTRKSLE